MKKQRIKLKNTPQVKKYNEVLKKAKKMTKEEYFKKIEGKVYCFRRFGKGEWERWETSYKDEPYIYWSDNN